MQDKPNFYVLILCIMDRMLEYKVCVFGNLIGIFLNGRQLGIPLQGQCNSQNSHELSHMAIPYFIVRFACYSLYHVAQI